jgi:hypothetical protein
MQKGGVERLSRVHGRSAMVDPRVVDDARMVVVGASVHRRLTAHRQLRGRRAVVEGACQCMIVVGAGEVRAAASSARL